MRTRRRTSDTGAIDTDIAMMPAIGVVETMTVIEANAGDTAMSMKGIDVRIATAHAGIATGLLRIAVQDLDRYHPRGAGMIETEMHDTPSLIGEEITAHPGLAHHRDGVKKIAEIVEDHTPARDGQDHQTRALAHRFGLDGAKMNLVGVRVGGLRPHTLEVETTSHTALLPRTRPRTRLMRKLNAPGSWPQCIPMPTV